MCVSLYLSIFILVNVFSHCNCCIFFLLYDADTMMLYWHLVDTLYRLLETGWTVQRKEGCLHLDLSVKSSLIGLKLKKQPKLEDLLYLEWRSDGRIVNYWRIRRLFPFVQKLIKICNLEWNRFLTTFMNPELNVAEFTWI